MSYSQLASVFHGDRIGITRVFLRHFRDPIRVPRISNRVLRIRENYHRVPKIRENRVPIIRETGSLQIQTGFLTFSLKKTLGITCKDGKLALLVPVAFAWKTS